jgi:predicted Zn-dependent protease
MKIFCLASVMLLSAILLFICGCATVAHTDRTQLMMVSEENEVAMGNEAWQQVMASEKLSTDAEKIHTVERIGGNIVKSLGTTANKYPWEFKVIESDTANAFALPGGKVAVYSGLFKYAANDAELAAVMGHEIAHVIARHGAERMSHQMALQVGGAIAAAFMQESQVQNMDLWMQAYGVAANVGAILPYSRKHEYEADYLGLLYMAKAGYDPRAAIAFWNKFSDPSKESALTAFLSTHPMSSDRIQEMNRRMPEALAYYQQSRRK